MSSPEAPASVRPIDDAEHCVTALPFMRTVRPDQFALADTFTCLHPLPSGIILRRAARTDGDQLFSLMRRVAQQRGTLAREVDEVTREYTDGMLAAMDGGLIIVAEFIGGANETTDNSLPRGTVVGVLKSSRLGPHRCFRGVLGDTTIAIRSEYQNKKLGQLMFAEYFRLLATEAEFAHVLRVELIARESNRFALAMYEKCGFRVQTKLHSRIVSGMALNYTENGADFDLHFEADIVMVWFNPAFKLEALKQQFREVPSAS
jgi:ribosomal protein S18 acetylase RimI-like enzyme